ncbi:hypothetical protein PBI_DEWDROP_109 [Microbacterium phage Dewdrop]|nr:hypothetical protein PBI_LEAF_109 [Microbacterium phage Leaf]QGZ17477.1 hypothetical protein PBI_DEWDROP_109 [Microbacterium phage Dewdrop]
MGEAKTTELYVIIDDNSQLVAEVQAEVRRMKGVWGVGSIPKTSNDALTEALTEYKKLTEMANGDRVLVSPEALHRAQMLVMVAAQSAQAESLAKLAAAVNDENIGYWLSRMIRETGATR